MASKNYRIGRSFEYRVQNYLRAKGYYVIRSYGSHGMYDLIAIPPTDPNNPDFHNYPLMIQCKTNGYVKPEERKSLSDCRTKWQGFQIIAVNERGKILFMTLDKTIIKSI